MGIGVDKSGHGPENHAAEERKGRGRYELGEFLGQGTIRLTAARSSGGVAGVRAGRLLPGAVCALLMCWAWGCALHKTPERVAPPVAVPREFSQTGQGEGPDRWWLSFGDAELNGLMERAFAGNLDLQAAWARVAQAQAIARRTGADDDVKLTADLEATRFRTETRTPTGGLRKSTDSLYSLSFAVSYEVDLWRRLESLTQAAALDLQISRNDLDAAAISLAGQIAETWYALKEQHAQEKLLLEQMRVSRTYLDLVEWRFSQGQASAVEVYQQRTQVASLESQLPLVRGQGKVRAHLLSVLAGRPPGEEVASPDDALPGVPALPALGIPSQLLTRRPDVRAAHARLRAADYRVAAAVADRLPALRLSATSVYSGPEPSEMFNSWVWGIAGNIVYPILDERRRAAEQARTEAVVQEYARVYGQTVLTALREVEDALFLEAHQRQHVASLGRRLELAKATLRQSRLHYVNGLSDYLPVLIALQGVQALEREIVSAQVQLIVYRIQLHRALGGAWPRELAAPEKTAIMSTEGEAER